MASKKIRHKSRSSSSNEQFKKSKRKHHKSHRKRDKSSPTLETNRREENDDKYDISGYKCSYNSKKNDICGYTDDTNPFMDSSLTQPFIWKKNKNHTHTDCRTKEAELEKVQKRMREHERIREERQREQEIIQRAKESQNSICRKPDSVFDLEQAIIRSKIRIKSERGQPIDYLIQYINEENESTTHSDVIMHEPLHFLLKLDKNKLNDLIVDIDNYSRNMVPGKNMQYWEDLKVITEDELLKLTKPQSGRDEGVAKESVEDMKNMILSGSIEEAIQLYNDAKEMLEINDNKHIDIAYYEYFCRFAKVLIAKRRIKENHLKNLKTQLNKLKEEQNLNETNLLAKDENKSPIISSKFTIQEERTAVELKTEREKYIYDLYEPKLLKEELVKEEAIDNVIYLAEDDAKKLELMRKQFLKLGHQSLSNEDKLLLLAQKGDEKDDKNFTDQVQLEERSFLWSDKYRPRKPQFLNRVNTGFDWNKYNQTHYDIDNPPPKIVQGYKFNILYSDLIDKSKTPTFEVSICPDDDQQAIITFKAGPPYQDIAFKIVNREWETSERFGYKCQFYRDMLQVHFHFKRYRYRK